MKSLGTNKSIKNIHTIIQSKFFGQLFVFFRIIILSLAITETIGVFVKNISYDLGYDIQITSFVRLNFYVIFVGLVCIKFLLTNFKIYDSFDKVNLLNVLKLSLLCIFIFYFDIESAAQSHAKFSLFLLCLYFIAGYLTSKKFFLYIVGKVNLSYAIGFLVFVSIASPITVPRYLNSESFYHDFDLSGIENVEVKRNRIELNKDSLDVLYLNETLLKANNIIYEPYVIIKEKNNIFLEFDNTKYSYGILCLLSTSYQGKANSANECLLDFLDSNLFSNYVDNKFKFTEFLKKLKFVQSGIEISLINLINKNINIHIKKNQKHSTKEIYKTASVMITGGGLFHHFNSIASSLYSKDKNYFDSQYGFGPSIIVDLIGKFFSLTMIDSIYLSIFIVNFFVFLFLFFYLRQTKNFKYVCLGYSFSILITMLVSGIMAPFLYFIRYLPSLFLFVLFYKYSWLNNSSFSFRFLTVFTIMLFLSAFFNAEYAVLTSLVVIFYGLSLRSAYFTTSGLISISLSFVNYFYRSTNTQSSDSLAYLFGIARPASPDILCILYLFLLLIVIFYFFDEIMKNYKKVPYDFFMIIFFIFFSIKVVWIGSINHVAGLFLFFYLIYARYSYKNSLTNKDQGIYFKYTYLIPIVIMTLSFLKIGVSHYFYSNSFETINYIENPNISKFFKVDNELNLKALNFQSIYRNEDLVISPIDNVLSIYVNNKVTSPTSDYSTNLNLNKDLFKIKYSLSKANRIIVDREILTNEKKYNEKFIPLLNIIPTFTRDISIFYYGRINNLNLLYESVKDEFYECETSYFFVILCGK